AAPAAARPAAQSTAAAAASFLGEEDEELATKVNALPPVEAPKKPAAQPAAKPAAPAKPAVSISAAPAKKPQQGEDRTVVVSTSNSLPKSDDDVDFTSIIDNLGE
ncbi:MAG: hypothetical protein AB1938_29750, partial [Myxococcota bacterium]